jgi:hypothetical protein
MRRARGSVIVVASALAALSAAGCGTSDESFALQARGGTYVDGTGRLGLAVLTTLRNKGGAGPSAEWSGSLSGPVGPVGGTVTYSGAGPGSWSASWWPEEPSYGGTYSLELAPAGGAGLAAGFEVGDGTGIAPPHPSLSEASPSISWGAVPGAAAYECRVYGDVGVALRWLGSATTCDLSALPSGAYAASVLAYSADLVAIAASASRRPVLPDRFDVSEARLALSRTDGAPPVAVLGAVGGGFHDGTSSPGRGLAVWVSILNADGSPTAVPWTVEVVGPGLPATAPMRFTYPANFSRIMVWAAVPASPGSYGLIARSSAGALGRPLAIGTLPTIDAPMGMVASAGAQGSATVTWSAVTGAASYLVSARHRATQDFVMSQWVAGPVASFPAYTFVADETYDVFVAATDADMVGGTPPTQFAITENSFEPASFVGR